MDDSTPQVAKLGNLAEYIPPTIREQLEQQRAATMQRLKMIENAIALLQENPSFEKIHDAISRLHLNLR